MVFTILLCLFLGILLLNFVVLSITLCFQKIPRVKKIHDKSFNILLVCLCAYPFFWFIGLGAQDEWNKRESFKEKQREEAEYTKFVDNIVRKLGSEKADIDAPIKALIDQQKEILSSG